MAHPFKHAESSARRFGGKPEDYLVIHNWSTNQSPFSQTSAIAHSVTTLKAFT